MAVAINRKISMVLALCWAVCTPMADAPAATLERVEFEGASQQLISGGLVRGDRIQGYLAKPAGAGPFPGVIGLHGCAGMHEATKQKVADDLVAWGYVLLLVDSFATRGVEEACTGGSFFARAGKRPADAYGGLAFLTRQNFVDAQRVGAVGFSQGAWAALSVVESNAFEPFILPGNARFRAAVAFYPPCLLAGRRPVTPTLILIGALDDWTPAEHCSNRVAGWGDDGPPIELVVYPGVHHSFYYPHFQPGVNLFGHWLEYNDAAADDASSRLHRFLDRHLK
jgi:dienelactone hydrolase